MPLTGSLNEIGIIDLIQFPHQGRKTGRLSVNNGNGLNANLFYKEGKLIHAVNGNATGIEAVVAIVDVEQGDFVFEGGIDSSESTIDMDLHHTILSALKVRDERKAEQERMRAEMERKKEENAAKTANQELIEFLAQNVDRTPWINYLAILGEDAAVVAEASSARKKETGANYEPLQAAIINFLRAYPNGKIGKMVIDQGDGIIMTSIISHGHLLLMVCGPEAIMGAVVANMSKMTAILQKLLEK